MSAQLKTQHQLPSGSIFTAFYRDEGHRVPYMTCRSLPMGENWMPRLSGEEAAALERRVEDYYKQGLFIDL